MKNFSISFIIIFVVLFSCRTAKTDREKIKNQEKEKVSELIFSEEKKDSSLNFNFEEKKDSSLNFDHTKKEVEIFDFDSFFRKINFKYSGGFFEMKINDQHIILNGDAELEFSEVKETQKKNLNKSEDEKTMFSGESSIDIKKDFESSSSSDLKSGSEFEKETELKKKNIDVSKETKSFPFGIIVGIVILLVSFFYIYINNKKKKWKL